MASLTPVDQDPFAAPPGANLTPVDHDPFAGSSAPAPGGQTPTWTDFLLQHLAAGTPWDPNAPKKTLSTTALWDKPADVSWGDYMAAHFQPVDDAVRSATNVFGLGDRFAAGMSNLTGVGGGDLAAQRAQSAAAAKRDPSMTAAGSLIGGLPVTELGIGSKIGEASLPYVSKLPFVGQGKWLSGVLGGGAEGVGTVEAGAYGRTGEGASPLELAVGALGGVPGGVVGRGGTLPPAQTADALRDAAETTYKPLSNVLYDATKEVHPQIDPIDAQNALRDWSGYKWGDASKTSKEIQTLLDKPQLSANDIQQSQSYLKSIANNPLADANDKLYASYFGKKLQGVLDNGTPQTGVPQNWTPTPGGPPSFASTVKAQGDALFGQAKDAERLDKMVAASEVNQGPDVATQSRSYLTSAKGQRYAPPGSPQYDAYNTIAATSNKSGYVPWWVKHYVIAPTIGAGIGAGIGGVSGETEGHSPWTHALEDAAIGATLGGFSGGYSGGTGAVNRATQQRAIDAARSTFSTGQFQTPLMPDAPFRDAVRQLIFGQGAGGRF